MKLFGKKKVKEISDEDWGKGKLACEYFGYPAGTFVRFCYLNGQQQHGLEQIEFGKMSPAIVYTRDGTILHVHPMDVMHPRAPDWGIPQYKK